ncbi:unnamed protein product [Ectocarpus sp. 4 AP-2014]
MTDTGTAAAAKPVDEGKEQAVMTRVGRRSDFGWEGRGWKFTVEELENPPSLKKSSRMGCDQADPLWRAQQLRYDKEHRSQAHKLMLEICKRLKTKAVVIAGAMTIYQRFLALVSFAENNLHDTVAASVLLASKVEDFKIHIKDVLIATNKVANHAIIGRLDPSEAYKRFKDRVVKVENKIMSALGFDFLIEHAYPHANDLILYFRRMGWVREDMRALISKGCCHLLSQSLKWTMCLEYPPTFRARLATYLSLLVNHVRPPPSGEWTEVLQFKDPGRLERATEQWLETLDNDTGKSGTKITRKRVTDALAEQRDDAQWRNRIASALGRPSVTTNKIFDGRRPSMPPPPPKVPLSHSRGATGGGLTCGKVSTNDISSCMGQHRASYSTKPPTHATTSKRKRMEAGAGTASDTAEKRPRPRPPLPRGVPPNNARSSSSWTSRSGPPATTNKPKACPPRPPSTPKPRPPNTPKPRPPTTPRPPSMPKPLRRSTPLPPNTPKLNKSFTPSPPNAPKPPVTLAARSPSTRKPQPPTTPKPRQPNTPNLLKKPAPRPPTTPKPLQMSTRLTVTTTMVLESLTPRPPCTHNLLKKPTPQPPTTPKPFQTSKPLPVTTIKGLESLTHPPPSTPKPIGMPITPPPPCTPNSLTSSAPLPVSTAMPPVTPTPRTPSALEPKSEPTSCAGSKPPSMPKGASTVASAASSRLPSYGKAPRPPLTARPTPLGKAPPAKKPRPLPCPRLPPKTHLSRVDSVGDSSLTNTGPVLDSADSKRQCNGGSSQMAFKAKADACMESNGGADSTRGGGLDGKTMDRRESGMLAQDDRNNRKRSRDESTEDASAEPHGSRGKRPKTGSDSEGASGSEGGSTSTSSPGKTDGTDDDEIEEGEIVEMPNRPVFERACAAWGAR